MSIDLESLVADAMSEFLDEPTKKASTKKAAPVEPTPEPVLKKSGATLKSGERWFSDLFGAKPKDGDFGVPLYDKPSPAVAHLIPKVDPAYKVQVEEAARLVAAFVDGDKTLMTGPTGSGKSSLVKYVCAKLGLPFIRVNMSADIESAALFGQLVVREGATVWEDGPITEAVRHGAVCLIDEWELMPPEISMGLQNLLEDDGHLYLKEMPGSSADKMIYPAPYHRIVCGGNTVGQGDDSGSFSGTMVQNSATLDRFTTTIHLDYLSAKHEKDIIASRSSVPAAIAEKMIKVASLVRSAYNQQQVNLTMSPRTLINWAKKIDRHGDVELAFNIAFYDKLRASDKRAVKEMFSKVF